MVARLPSAVASTATSRAKPPRAPDYPWRLSRRAAAPPKPTTPFDEFKRARGIRSVASEGGAPRDGEVDPAHVKMLLKDLDNLPPPRPLSAQPLGGVRALF